MTATQTTLTIAQALRNASRIEGRISTITQRPRPTSAGARTWNQSSSSTIWSPSARSWSRS